MVSNLVVTTQEDLRSIVMDCVNACLNRQNKDEEKSKSSNPDPKRFGTANTCAKRYGVHFNTIRNWHKRGFIKKSVVDGLSLYEFAEIDDFIRSKAS